MELWYCLHSIHSLIICLVILLPHQYYCVNYAPDYSIATCSPTMQVGSLQMYGFPKQTLRDASTQVLISAHAYASYGKWPSQHIFINIFNSKVSIKIRHHFSYNYACPYEKYVLKSTQESQSFIIFFSRELTH